MPPSLLRLTSAPFRAADSLLGKLCVIPVIGWKRLISPFLGEHCRFTPTCSEYAAQAFQRHGFLYGLWLGARRLVRCNPWCEGGEDACPPRKVRPEERQR